MTNVRVHVETRSELTAEASETPNPYGDPAADYDLASRVASIDVGSFFMFASCVICRILLPGLQLNGTAAYNSLDMLQPLTYDHGSQYLEHTGYYQQIPAFVRQPVSSSGISAHPPLNVTSTLCTAQLPSLHSPSIPPSF